MPRPRASRSGRIRCLLLCADSRIDPNEITSTGPGEVFVTRNIGNMVPAYGEMLGGVSAVIEFAVSGLGVRHIAVCGHSDCGAMKALLDPESVAKMPTVRELVKERPRRFERGGDADERLPDRDLMQELTEQNVLPQLQHLKTHPSVAAAMAAGDLTLFRVGVRDWQWSGADGSGREPHI